MPDVLRLLAHTEDAQRERLREALRGLRPEQLPAWLRWAKEQTTEGAQELVRRRAERRAARISEMFLAGLSDAEIAQEIGTTRDAIRMERSRLRLRRAA